MAHSGQYGEHMSTPVMDDATARPRDAAVTRQLLLSAARRRFAIDGYRATTVRDIASDAGVNVALISRYFDSKEGLFEACLTRAAEDFVQPAGRALDHVIQNVVSQVASPLGDERSLQLLLLLRTSGDEHADTIRRNILASYAERIAAVAGWRPADSDARQLLLRAQLAIATALGVAVLRSSSSFELLGAATEDDLTAPIGDVFTALLGGPASRA
jgi:AcrR family transcriptional regulator